MTERYADLTDLELGVYDILCQKQEVHWLSTSRTETATLNRLVKKGYATYDRNSLSWYPIKRE